MRRRVVVAALVALPGLLPECTLLTSLDGLSGGEPRLTQTPGIAEGGADANLSTDHDEKGDVADAASRDVEIGDISEASPGADAAIDPADGPVVDARGQEASPSDAGDLETLVSGRSNLGGIGLDATFVYWVESASNSLWRVRKTGGSAERVDVAGDTVSAPYDVSVSAGTLYWTERQGAVIAYRPLSGGTRQQLPSTGAALLGFIAVDGNTAYATDFVTSIATSGNVFIDSTTAGGVFSNQPNTVSGIDVRVGTVVFAQATYHAILSNPTGQNAASYIGYTTGDIAGLAFDGNDIYFLEDERAITRMSASDGSTSSFVDLGSRVGSGDVAVDGARVYWSEPSVGRIRSKSL